MVTKTQKTTTPRQQKEITFTISFNSEIPTGWRHRNTRWTQLYNAMDTLLDDTNENVRVELDKKYSKDDVSAAFGDIRSAMYRWAYRAKLTDTFRVYTATGTDVTTGTPYIVGWIAEKE